MNLKSSRNTKTWTQHQQLAGHKLTVTQMRFSPNDEYLLTVSRDRCWLLYKNTMMNHQSSNLEQTLPTYQFICRSDNSEIFHTRVIWSCDWTYDSNYFVTVSRDGQAVVWGHTENKTSEDGTVIGELWESCAYNAFKKQAITAVSCYPAAERVNNGPKYTMAIGCDNGQLALIRFTNDSELNLLINFDTS